MIIQKLYCVDLDYNETLGHWTFWCSSPRVEQLLHSYGETRTLKLCVNNCSNAHFGKSGHINY